MTGARIELTQARLVLVAAELLASTRAFGFILTEGQQMLRKYSARAWEYRWRYVRRRS
jgi:ABC-type nitrate/sulfonate/bicarbonate transport system permease component